MLRENVLRKEIVEGRSDKDYHELLKIDGKKFRVSIRANHYRTQSSARVSIWSEASDKWEFVSSIPHQNMNSYITHYEFKKNINEDKLNDFNKKCRTLFGHGFEYHECAFKLDRDRLIEDVKNIVF